MQFAGEIKKAEHKMAGDKPLCEVSLCRKHKGSNGAEATFTWLRVCLWQPAEFQTGKLVKGAFIAGSGDVELRSYTAKDGTKGHSLECRCTSFDVEVTEGRPQEQTGPIASHAAKPVDSQAKRAAPTGGGYDDSEPPFNRLTSADSWG
jgi:single-stranded DNA-binding protein